MTNLWNIKKIDESQNPISTLEEQGKLLLESTHNRIGATVTKSNSNKGAFTVRFDITPPSIPDYSFRVFSITCSPILYPIKIRCDENIANELELDSTEKYSGITCKDYDEFIDNLAKILGTEYISQVIASIEIMVSNKIAF